MNMKWKVYYDTYKRLAQNLPGLCVLSFLSFFYSRLQSPPFHLTLSYVIWADSEISYTVTVYLGGTVRLPDFARRNTGDFFSVDASKPSSLEKLANLWWSINPMRSGRSTLAACLSAAALNKWLVEAVQWTAGQLVLPLPGRYSSLWLF